MPSAALRRVGSHRLAFMKSSRISWAVFDHTIGRLAKAEFPR